MDATSRRLMLLAETGDRAGGMDSTEVNKIMAALLIAGVVFALGGVLGDALVGSNPPDKPAFIITGLARAIPVASLLAAADARQGQAEAARQCGGCHSFDKGGAAIVGPNLYDVVDAPVGKGRDYDFSSALAGKTGRWTFAAIDLWLKDPSQWAPGTKMGFAGIASDRQRANVIAYLRTLSQHPVPLPPGAGQAARD